MAYWSPRDCQCLTAKRKLKDFKIVNNYTEQIHPGETNPNYHTAKIPTETGNPSAGPSELWIQEVRGII